MIRECFPRSILLGSVDDQVQITDSCLPVAIEENYISACICTSDLCNGEQEEGLEEGSDTIDGDDSGRKEVIDESI